MGAGLEVNIFYDKEGRREAIREVLQSHGAEIVYGVDDLDALIPGLESSRGRVSSRGIYISDVVFVPLEDGDRTEALKRMGKIVITVDLNPLSRTSRKADITIVDNIVRAVPKMIEIANKYSMMSRESLIDIVNRYDNNSVLAETLSYIINRLNNIIDNLRMKM